MIFLRLFIVTSFLTQGLLTPRALRAGHTNRGTTFTATMRMVAWGHGRTANGRTDTQMSFPASLPQFDIAMIQIANLANGCIAFLARSGELHPMAVEHGRNRLLWPKAGLHHRRTAPTGHRDPFFNSMLWIMVPVGILLMGRLFPA